MKNILLIGLGRFGRHMAEQLNQMGHEIMAVDLNEERVEKVLPFVTNAQIGDCTDADYLRSLGIRNYDICFVAIGGSFQNSLETTSLLKRTWCEAGSCKSRTRCSGKIPSEKWSRQRDLSRKAGGKMGIYPIC